MKFKNLKESEKEHIHSILEELKILSISDTEDVKIFFDLLPNKITDAPIEYDSKVHNKMREWFKKNIDLENLNTYYLKK